VSIQAVFRQQKFDTGKIRDLERPLGNTISFTTWRRLPRPRQRNGQQRYPMTKNQNYKLNRR